MPKVFIPVEMPYDFSKAKRYGDLTFVLNGRVNVYRPADMLPTIKKVMAGSSSDDRIVVSGLPTALGLIMAEFAMQHGKVNLLIFNGEDYEAREVIMAAAHNLGNQPKRKLPR